MGGWIAPPRIEVVERRADAVLVRGRVAPLGRVVLRGAGNTAFAAGADETGRFEVRMPTLGTDSLFVAETRNGQDATPAPYRLLIARDAGGPIALLSPGAPSRRLDAAGPLDVIDSDGRRLLASGRASPGAVLSVAVAGAPSTQVIAGPDGRWSLALAASGAGPAAVQVEGRTYAYPGPGGGDEGPVLEQAGAGWRSTWTVSSSARQSSWFPVG